MTRRAAIDIGTNSVKLTVLDLSRRPPRSLCELVVVTRLGQGVRKNGRLLPGAVQRTLRVVRRFQRRARRLGAEPVILATEALRRARNRRLLTDALQAPLTILTRKREAELSYLGARTFLRAPDALLVDIGGGTIELLIARRNRLRRDATLPLGCVYLTEQFLTSDPPTPGQLDKLERHIEARLRAFPIPQSNSIIGIGGSVATVAFSLSRRRRFDTEVFNGRRIPAATLHRLYRAWSAVDSKTRIRRFRVDPARSDVILAAMAVLRHLADRAGARSIVVCTYGVRHGALLAPIGAVY